MSVTAHDVLVLIQVRTGSSRLPGKVLMPLGSSTVLDQMWTRLTQAQIPAKFAMITTVDPSDEPIREYCSQKNILCYSGSVNDLLDRHYQAWKLWGGKYVVKIPSDCPLIDPKVMEQVVGYFLESGNLDYASNLHPQSFPDGNDVEIFTQEALETAWKEAKKDFEREHTTSFIWDNPDRFRLGNFALGEDFSRNYRYTLDYIEDYELICQVFNALYPVSPWFTYKQIMDWLDQNPLARAINTKHLGYVWYQKHSNDLRTLR